MQDPFAQLEKADQRPGGDQSSYFLRQVCYIANYIYILLLLQKKGWVQNFTAENAFIIYHDSYLEDTNFLVIGYGSLNNLYYSTKNTQTKSEEACLPALCFSRRTLNTNHSY